ncbi:MAG TPA: hypothetical protein VGC71_06355 [Gaiellales bacterium]|jgi:hypothetical protein
MDTDDGPVFVPLHTSEKNFARFDVAAYAGFIPVEHEAARDLLLDPLPILAGAIPEVQDDWQVTVTRVDGEFGIVWPQGGPHHLCVLIMALPRFGRVHCLVHRFPPYEDANEV